MDKFAASSDGTKIRYEATGKGPTALLFVHGSLGSGRWWDAQRDHFAGRYVVAQMDLAGHGGSDKSRPLWSLRGMAEDIKAVAGRIEARNLVLVGHSMAGAYALEASLIVPRTRAVVLVDTMKDLDQAMTYEQAEELLFKPYRRDFQGTVENVLPRYLFAASTPPAVRARLVADCLKNDAESAINAIEPYYRMDARVTAKRVRAPVRAINSDSAPTRRDNNLKYFRDYEYLTLSGTGHYPMVEKPEEFNRLLDETLRGLSL